MVFDFVTPPLSTWMRRRIVMRRIQSPMRSVAAGFDPSRRICRTGNESALCLAKTTRSGSTRRQKMYDNFEMSGSAEVNQLTAEKHTEMGRAHGGPKITKAQVG